MIFESNAVNTTLANPLSEHTPCHSGVQDELVLDNGATTSIVSNAKLLSNIHVLHEPVTVYGVGPQPITVTQGGTLANFGFALYTPTIRRNLLAWNMVKTRLKWEPKHDRFVISDDNNDEYAIFNANELGLYTYKVPPTTMAYLTSTIDSSTAADRSRWAAAIQLHQTLDHPGDAALSTALDKGCYAACKITSKDLREARDVYGPCTRCLAAKMTQEPSPASTTPPPETIGHTLHADIVLVRGANNRKVPYLLTVEARTSYIVVSKMASKTREAVANAVKIVVNKYKSYHHTVCILRTDREAVFNAAESDINALGVQLHRSSPDRHEKRCERMVRTIRERMRATLGGLSYQLPGRLYSNLLFHVCTSINLLPNVRTTDVSPRELVTGEKTIADVSLTVPFGSLAMFRRPDRSHNPSVDHLDRSEMGIITGRDLNSRGSVQAFIIGSEELVVRHTYVVVPITQDVTSRLEAISESENLPQHDWTIYDIDDYSTEVETPSLIYEPETDAPMDITPYASEDSIQHPQQDDIPNSVLPEISTPEISPSTLIPDPISPPMLEPDPILRGSWTDLDATNIITPNADGSRTRRTNKTPSASLICETGEIYNITLKKAQKEYGIPRATASAGAELTNQIDFGALQPEHASSLTRAEFARILPSHLFLKEKFDASGKFLSLKARLVGGGNHQDRSDYENITSPTVRTQSVFVSLNEAATERRNISTIDVKGAYLNANLKDVTVHIRMQKDLVKVLIDLYPHYQPFVRADGSMILRVKKALYGLIESAMLWYENLKSTLLSLGYVNLESDQGMFIRTTPLGRSTICVHVDDLLITSTHISHDIHLRDGMNAAYKGITLHEGPSLTYLGMLIEVDKANQTISVSQPGYIDDLIKTYAPRIKHKTPCTPGIMKVTPNAQTIEISEHRSKVMQLSYLSNRTRPDILYTVSYLITRLNCPTTDDRYICDHLLGYLLYTKDLKTTFHSSSMNLICYADASYAMHEDARSHFGITMQFGHHNAPFHNKSGVIKVVARSSTEAEIAALNELISEILHTRDLLEEMGHSQPATLIFEDNTACIELLEGPITNYQTRSRHIKVRYAFFKQYLESEEVILCHCPTDEMLADVYTKPLTGQKFITFRDQLLGIRRKYRN